MQNFRLTKLTHYKNTNGIITLVEEEVPEYPLNLKLEIAREAVERLNPSYVITQLYKVDFGDKEICTTMEGANDKPITADILVIEVAFSCILIFAHLGDMCINILLDINDGEEVEITQEYKDFEWIKRASDETLKVMCKIAIAKIAESKEALKQLITPTNPN